MTDTTIQGLGAATTLSLADTLPSDQSDGITRKLSLQQVWALFSLSLPASTAPPGPGLVYSDGTAFQNATFGPGVALNAGVLSATGTFVLPASAALVGSDAAGKPLAVTLDPSLSMTAGRLALAHPIPASAGLLGSNAAGVVQAITPGAGLSLLNNSLVATASYAHIAYFNGTNQAGATLAAGVATQIPLTVVSDKSGNFNPATGTWTAPFPGTFRLTATASFLVTGAAGAAPAGTRIGLNVSATATSTGMHYGQTGSVSSGLSYERQAVLPEGATVILLSECDAANGLAKADLYIELVDYGA